MGNKVEADQAVKIENKKLITGNLRNFMSSRIARKTSANSVENDDNSLMPANRNMCDSLDRQFFDVSKKGASHKRNCSWGTFKYIDSGHHLLETAKKTPHSKLSKIASPKTPNSHKLFKNNTSSAVCSLNEDSPKHSFKYLLGGLKRKKKKAATVSSDDSRQKTGSSNVALLKRTAAKRKPSSRLPKRSSLSCDEDIIKTILNENYMMKKYLSKSSSSARHELTSPSIFQTESSDKTFIDTYRNDSAMKRRHAAHYCKNCGRDSCRYGSRADYLNYIQALKRTLDKEPQPERDFALDYSNSSANELSHNLPPPIYLLGDDEEDEPCGIITNIEHKPLMYENSDMDSNTFSMVRTNDNPLNPKKSLFQITSVVSGMSPTKQQRFLPIPASHSRKNSKIQPSAPVNSHLIIDSVSDVITENAKARRSHNFELHTSNREAKKRNNISRFEIIEKHNNDDEKIISPHVVDGSDKRFKTKPRFKVLAVNQNRKFMNGRWHCLESRLSTVGSSTSVKKSIESVSVREHAKEEGGKGEMNNGLAALKELDSRAANADKNAAASEAQSVSMSTSLARNSKQKTYLNSRDNLGESGSSSEDDLGEYAMQMLGVIKSRYKSRMKRMREKCKKMETENVKLKSQVEILEKQLYMLFDRVNNFKDAGKYDTGTVEDNINVARTDSCELTKNANTITSNMNVLHNMNNPEVYYFTWDSNEGSLLNFKEAQNQDSSNMTERARTNYESSKKASKFEIIEDNVVVEQEQEKVKKTFFVESVTENELRRTKTDEMTRAYSISTRSKSFTDENYQSCDCKVSDAHDQTF